MERRGEDRGGTRMNEGEKGVEGVKGERQVSEES